MKLTKVLLATTLLLVVGGCSKKADMKTTTCSIDLEFMTMSAVLDYDANSNKVHKQTTTNVLSISQSGSTKEEIEAVVEEAKESYNIKGVTYDYTFGDDSVTETTTVDYTDTDFKELLAAGLIESTDETKVMTYIDYELTIDGLEEAGLTCK